MLGTVSIALPVEGLHTYSTDQPKDDPTWSGRGTNQHEPHVMMPGARSPSLDVWTCAHCGHQSFSISSQNLGMLWNRQNNEQHNMHLLARSANSRQYHTIGTYVETMGHSRLNMFRFLISHVRNLSHSETHAAEVTLSSCRRQVFEFHCVKLEDLTSATWKCDFCSMVLLENKNMSFTMLHAALSVMAFILRRPSYGAFGDQRSSRPPSGSGSLAWSPPFHSSGQLECCTQAHSDACCCSSSQGLQIRCSGAAEVHGYIVLHLLADLYKQSILG